MSKRKFLLLWIAVVISVITTIVVLTVVYTRQNQITHSSGSSVVANSNSENFSTSEQGSTSDQEPEENPYLLPDIEVEDEDDFPSFRLDGSDFVLLQSESGFNLDDWIYSKWSFSVSDAIYSSISEGFYEIGYVVASVYDFEQARNTYGIYCDWLTAFRKMNVVFQTGTLALTDIYDDIDRNPVVKRFDVVRNHVTSNFTDPYVCVVYIKNAEDLFYDISFFESLTVPDEAPLWSIVSDYVPGIEFAGKQAGATEGYGYLRWEFAVHPEICKMVSDCDNIDLVYLVAPTSSLPRPYARDILSTLQGLDRTYILFEVEQLHWDDMSYAGWCALRMEHIKETNLDRDFSCVLCVRIRNVLDGEDQLIYPQIGWDETSISVLDYYFNEGGYL